MSAPTTGIRPTSAGNATSSDRRAELDFASEIGSEFGGHFPAMMDDPDMIGHQPAVGELPAKANQDGQPELDVLPVAAPLDIDIAQADARSRAPREG